MVECPYHMTIDSPKLHSERNVYNMVYKVDNFTNLSESASVMNTTLERKGDKMKLTSDQQAVVDEFTDVIRKHHDQAPGTLARLVRLAFESSLGAGESRD